MIGLGTLVNCGTVIAGTTIGLVLKGGLPERFEKTIMSALGLCSFFIGIGGALENMLVIENGVISTQYTMLLVLCMVLSICPLTVFAAGDEKTTLNLVSFGDSMTNGYGHEGYYEEKD